MRRFSPQLRFLASLLLLSASLIPSRVKLKDKQSGRKVAMRSASLLVEGALGALLRLDRKVCMQRATQFRRSGSLPSLSRERGCVCAGGFLIRQPA